MEDRNYHALTNIRTALATFAERNKTYGNSYHNFGHIAKAMFPKGLELLTVEDFNCYGVIFLMISKLSRYVADPHKGHLDSTHDLGVYSFILEELDALAQGKDAVLPVDQGGVSTDPDTCEHVWRGGLCQACGTAKYRGQGAEPHLIHIWNNAPIREFQACTICKITRQEWEEATK